MQRVFTKREKIIFYLTIGLAIFGVLFKFLLGPMLTRNESLNKEINYNRAKFKKYLWLISQKENLQGKYKKFYQSEKISSDITISALSELEQLGKASGVRIIDIRPEGITQGKDFYKELLIDLRTEGAMESYLKFIYEIENSISLLIIKKLKLTARPLSTLLEGSLSISQFLTPD